MDAQITIYQCARFVCCSFASLIYFQKIKNKNSRPIYFKMKLKIVTAASTTLTLLFGIMFCIFYAMYAEDRCWGFFPTLAGLSDCQDRAIALSRNAFCLSMITTIILLFSMLLFAMNQQHTLAEQKREADATARTHTLTELKKQMDDQVAWLPEVEKNSKRLLPLQVHDQHVCRLGKQNIEQLGPCSAYQQDQMRETPSAPSTHAY